MNDRRKPLIIGGVFAALSLIVLVFLVLPRMSAVGDRQKNLDAAEQQGQSLTAEVAALTDAKNNTDAVKKQLAALEEQIPSTTELPQLIREIRNAADRAAVDFVQISPGAPTLAAQGAYSTIPTQISATGSYFAVTEFMYRLEHMPRAIKVTNMTMGPGPDGLPQLQLQMSAEVYTVDVSAGPGSQPGPTTADPTTAAAATTGA